jgi:hypothetical protein
MKWTEAYEPQRMDNSRSGQAHSRDRSEGLYFSGSAVLLER